MNQAGTAWPAPDHLELIACPACHAALAGGQCQSCGQAFPLLDGVPVLFPDPWESLARWRNRWHAELARLRNEQLRLEAALPTSRGARRKRLEHRNGGLRGQQQALNDILAPLLADTATESDTATATRLLTDSAWYRYDANPFRDWCWGEAENAAALSQILLALADRPQTILQLGSGAGRLAYDLHRSLKPAATIAVEHNPLLALLGTQLAGGAAHRLWEFPLSPVLLEDTAVQQTLKRPEHHTSPPPGLTTLLADALALPLRSGQFDLIVTAWFSDVCPAPASWLCSTVNALLRPGGLWVNHGSAAFDPAAPTDVGSLDEFVAIAEEQKFSLAYQAEAELPYLQSPHSRQKRLERTGTQSFRKSEDAAAPSQLVPFRPRRPNWADDATIPIALGRAFTDQREASALRTFILSLVDGQRSRSDIADQLAARGILPKAEAEAALTDMLLNIQS